MTDITVSFGANTSNLTGAFAAAQKQVQAFGGTISSTSAQGSAALNTLTSAIEANKTSWLGVAAGVTAGTAAYNLLVEIFSSTWRGIVAVNSAIASIPQGMLAADNAAKSAATGLLNYAASQAYVAQYAPLVQLANEGLIASFGRGVLAVQNFIRAADIFRSGLLAVEGEAIAAAGNMERLQQAAAQLGFENATRLLQSYTVQLAQIPGMTNEAAAGIVSELGSITNFSGQATQALIDIIPKLSKTGDDAKTLAAGIANAFANPASNGVQFLATLGGVSAQLQEQFAVATRTGNVNQQQAVIYDALVAKVKLLGAEKTRELQESLASYAQLGPLGQLLSAGIRGQVDEAIRFNAELDKSVRSLQGEASAIRSLPQSREQTFTAAQPIIAGVRPQIDQIDELTGKLRTLYQEREQLKGGGSPFGTTMAPGSAEEVERNKEAIDQLEDSLRKLQDARKGGSAAELLEATQAQARAKFTLDEAAANRAMGAALDDEASKTKNLTEARKLTTQASEARAKADKLAADVAAAGFTREAAAAVEGSEEQEAATKRANAARRAVTQPGSAERVNLDAADEAAERKHQDVLTADAASAEDAKYQIAIRGVQERITTIKEEGTEHKISKQQEIADLNAVYAQEGALEKAHQTTLMGLYDEGTSQYRAAKQKLLQVDADINAKRLAAEREINQRISATQKQAVDQTASMFGTAIDGMITGQTKLSNAAKQIATQILSTYTQLAIKMVLNNSGAIGQMVAQVVTGEAAKTAATTVGVTARTSAETTGAAAASAGTIASVLHSIMASASETFAGIFGFLSPVLGPAAAAPAAAGEASVLAVAGGLATGAWELPRDMLVQAHQGEMVVPAGVTPWAQGALSGNVGPGGNSVHVNHATNFNVAAMDARSFHDYAMGNRKTLVRAINEGVRTGAHIGLRSLAPI